MQYAFENLQGSLNNMSRIMHLSVVLVFINVVVATGGCGAPRCEHNDRVTVGPAPATGCKAPQSGVLVCRDASGTYTMNGTCDASCVVEIRTSDIVCPCHSGTTWTFDGSAIDPASAPALAHYAACVDEDHNVWVDPATIVTAPTRY